MHPVKFIMIDIIGEFLYITIYIAIGYSFGAQWEEILDVIESFSSMILSGVLLSIGYYFFWKQMKKNREIIFLE